MKIDEKLYITLSVWQMRPLCLLGAVNSEQ